MHKNQKKQSSHSNSLILNSLPHGVVTIDNNWNITFINRTAITILRIEPKLVIGKSVHEILNADIFYPNSAFSKAVRQGHPVIDKIIFLNKQNGDRIKLTVTTSNLRDKSGNITGGIVAFRELNPHQMVTLDTNGINSISNIVSKNKQIQDIIALLPDIAHSSCHILIEGPSGSGKGLFARAIHALSHCADKEMITVNCGAIPDTLIESEFFGYKSGAFTGAKKNKPGRFAMAQDSTLFLDEIGEISPASQVRLLNVLEDKHYEPLGATHSLTTNARIIAASNRPLLKLVKDGRFRRDLYYRLNTIKIILPPLRSRSGDIPLLIEHFLNFFNAKYEKSIEGIHADAMWPLLQHDYPGNIRELEHYIEHAVILCHDKEIHHHHLPHSITKKIDVIPKKITSGRLTLKDLEREIISGALQKNNWNKTATAADLGIHKTTLFRKLKKLNLKKT